MTMPRYKVASSVTLKSGPRGTVERVTLTGGRVMIRRVIHDDARGVFDALSRLGSPRFPRVESVEFGDDTVVLEEDVPGLPLGEALITKRLTRGEALALSRELVRAVAEIEAAGIVHRDIKPDNIIISPELSALRLIDFGIARLAEDTPSEAAPLGTRGWAAPEQYGFSHADSRSDLYAAGLVIKALCDNAGLPPTCALAKFAARCAAFDPEARFRSAADALAAFRRAASRPKRAAAIAAAAAAIIALAAALLSRPDVPPPHRMYALQPPAQSVGWALSTGDKVDAAPPLAEYTRPPHVKTELSPGRLDIEIDGEPFAIELSPDADAAFTGTSLRGEIVWHDLDGDGRREMLASLSDGREDEFRDGTPWIMINRNIVRVFARSGGGWQMLSGGPDIQTPAYIIPGERGGAIIRASDYIYHVEAGGLTRNHFLDMPKILDSLSTAPAR